MPDATPRPDDFVADLLEAASRPGVESWHRSAWVDQVVRQFKTMASSGREMLQAQGLVTSHREGAATALDCVGTHNAGFWKRFEHLAHGETNNEGIQSTYATPHQATSKMRYATR